MIKAVIFDWGGVLIKNPSASLLRLSAKEFNTPKKQTSIAIEKYIKDFQRGWFTEREFVNSVAKKLGIPPPKLFWGKIFIRSYHERKEMFALATALRKQGYKIGYLSNTEVPAARHFKRQDHKQFHVTVFSCYEGTVKPEARIYRLILKRLKVRPHEAVFMDDLAENVTGARKVGLQAFRFTSVDQAQSQLKRLLKREQ